VAYVFAGKEAIPEALVAWGTIVLAFTTFLLVQETRTQEDRNRKFTLERDEQARKDDQERGERYRKASLETEERYRKAELEKEEHYRKDQRDREERDRKERLLNEIRDWVNSLNVKVLSLNIDRQQIKNLHLEELNTNLEISKIYFKQEEAFFNEQANCTYFLSSAKIFEDSNPTLCIKIKTIESLIKELIGILLILNDDFESIANIYEQEKKYQFGKRYVKIQYR
jgi:hypothetical protein